MSNSKEVLFEVRNKIAYLTLNRPKALNALSHDMVKVLQKCLNECASNSSVNAVLIEGNGKAFCAGGDIRAIYKLLLEGSDDVLDFFIDEYKLDLYIHNYAKPVITLMHGYTMGGGMGLVQGAQYRIVSETTSMAMPETAIGFFPDVGGSYFLSRCPGAFGYYIGITGLQINADEALYAGLADYKINPLQFSEFKNLLNSIQWNNDYSQDILHTIDQLNPVTRDALIPIPIIHLIDKHFSHSSIKGIIQSLQSEDDMRHIDWAKQMKNTISKRSPLSMCVTHEEIFRGRTLELADCFQMELNMLNECFQRNDFMEGVRALLIDKDNLPKWNPSNIDEIKLSDIEAFFSKK